MRALLLVLGTLAAMAANASGVVVEAVQYPAVLERGGLTVPLTPGTVLQSKDAIRTGGNARVELKLAEGSVVKLGENAQYNIERVQPGGIFAMAMGVLRGAFRFTTAALRQSAKRDVQIKVKNVTAGIRGTDVWGKSTDESDLVCLLEGKVTVGAEGHPQVTLDQPLDFYRKKTTEGPVVAKVDPEQVKKWAEETDLVKDGPTARAGGTWRVVAAIAANRDEAIALNRRLRSLGYPAQVGGQEAQPIYVYVGGLAGEAEARALMSNLRTVQGVTTPSVRQGP